LFLLNRGLIVLVCLISIAAFASESTEYIADSKKYIAKGQYSEAIIQLRNALKEDENNMQATVLLADAYITTGNAELASVELKKLRDKKYTNSHVEFLDLRQALLIKKLTYIQNIPVDMSAPPDELARIRALQGQTWLMQGDINKARSFFQRALLLDQNVHEAKVGQVKLLMAEDQYEKAKPLANALFKTHPYDIEILLVIGELRRSDEQLESALEVYKLAEKIQPENISAKLGIVSTLIDQKEYTEAKELATEVEEKEQDNVLAAFFKGLIEYKLENYADAQRALLKAIKLDVSHQESYRLLGAVLYKQKRNDEVQKWLLKYLEWQPKNISANTMLAAIYLEKKDANKVIRLLSPFSKFSVSAIHSLLGSAYLQVGQNAKSVQHLKIAAELSGHAKDLNTQYWLSQIAAGKSVDKTLTEAGADKLDDSTKRVFDILSALQNKKYDQAIIKANQAIEARPDSEELYNLLGSAYVGKENFNEAEKQYKLALEKNPKFHLAQVNLARIEMRRKDFEKAVRLYEKVLFNDKNNLTALMDMAWISNHQGDAEKALQWLERARKGNRSAMKPRLSLNHYYLSKGRLSQATAITQELVDVYPNQPQIIEIHIKNLLQDKQYLPVIKLYQKMAETQPKSATLFYRLAVLETKTERLGNAEKYFLKTLSLDPTFFLAELGLAKLEARSARMDQAFQRVEKILKKRPNNAVAAEVMGDFLLLKEQKQEAIKSYQHALLKGDSAKIAVKLYQTYEKQGETDKAHAVLSNWLKKHDKNIPVRLVLANSFEDHHQPELAVMQYKLVLAQNPKHVGALNNIAWSYIKLKDPRAIEYAETAYALNPESANVIDTLGWLLVQRGELERGMKMLRQALKLAPHKTAIRHHFADALNQSGDPKNAALEVKRVLLDEKYSDRDGAEALYQKVKKYIQ
jgi:putative PEP-CTERM system TPR-repeat lipoprotein